jgi:hypothetical protein
VSVKGRQPCWSVDRRVNLVGEPDAGNLHVRFHEREVETGHGKLLGHRQPKGPATRKASPKLPRHLSTLLTFFRFPALHGPSKASSSACDPVSGLKVARPSRRATCRSRLPELTSTRS